MSPAPRHRRKRHVAPRVRPVPLRTPRDAADWDAVVACELARLPWGRVVERLVRSYVAFEGGVCVLRPGDDGQSTR